MDRLATELSGCASHQMRGTAQATLQLPGHIAMTRQAECAQVGEIALSPTFAHRQNVVSVPQALAGHGLQPPVMQHPLAAGPASALQPAVRFNRIYFAKRATAAIASEYLLAEIAGVRPQPPFMDAPVGAESSPPAGNFHRAPATQRTAILSLR